MTLRLLDHQIKAFYDVHHTGSGKRAVSQALESIEMNVDWLERNEEESVTWFRQDGFIALPLTGDDGGTVKRSAEEL